MYRRHSLVLIAVTAACAFPGCCLIQPGCGGGVGGCGGVCDVGCAMEPGCGCEPACGCEPSCGCAENCIGGCFCGGNPVAGQRWRGDCDCEGCRINVCKGPECCDGGDPGCGVADCCGACDCGDPCGCGEPCGCGGPCGGGCRGRCGVASNLGFCAKCVASEVRNCLAPIFGPGPLCGCGGCDSELYWSEWHNDPPRCCDPCDNHGNWIGPSQAAYRAPYDHAFAPRRIAKQQQAGAEFVR